ncbi:MAG: cohesin domain-containing protein [Acidobacteriota bacterium]
MSAPSSPEKRRPEACLHPERLGPIRVQVGTNKMFVKVGHTIQIPVRVKGVCDLAAFHFGLAFNPRVARLVRVEQTPFLAGDPPVEIAFQGLRPGAGQQTIMGARPPGTGTVDGIGTLARLVFVGWTTGMTTIRLTRLHLQDGERREFRSFQVPVDLFVRPDHAPAGRR